MPCHRYDRPLIACSFVMLSLLAAGPGAAHAADQRAAVPEMHDCDRLAAHPHDDAAVAKGVSYADLDAAAAIAACESALEEEPDTLRFLTQLGRAQHKAGRHADALRTWRAGQIKGSVQSITFIATMYKSGQVVARNPREALRLFEMAANAGNVSAMVFAAGMHRRGEGTAKSNRRAAIWYDRAAQRGVGEAMTHLGVMNAFGRGVPRNHTRAAALIMEAYRLDDERARQILMERPRELSLATRKEIQRRLAAAGVYNNALDGQFGPATRQALETLPKD